MAVISIGDPGEDYPRWLPPQERFLRLEFDDIEDDLGPEYTMFDEQHVSRIIRFMQCQEDIDVGVHCYAGRSRAAAVAEGISRLFGHELLLSQSTTTHLDRKNKHVAWVFHRVLAFTDFPKRKEFIKEMLSAPDTTPK